MNNEKLNFSIANAMQQLCKCSKALAFPSVGEDKTKEVLKAHLNEAKAEIDASLREIGEDPIHMPTVQEKKPEQPQPPVKAPVPNFDTIAVRQVCGMIAMAYPNFCGQQLFETYQKDGFKPALNYLLNYVAKSNAEITVKNGEDYARTIEFKADPESFVVKNYKVTVAIICNLVYALGYKSVCGSFDVKNSSFSFEASMTKAAPAAAKPEKEENGRREDVVHPLASLVAHILHRGLI